MHRKAKFLLDVRGLLIINKMEGAYAEFGVFRGEMMYAASKVFGGNISKYFGFDTFEGLPEPKGKDSKTFVFEEVGFMKCPEDEVSELMSGTEFELIKGDFREEAIKTNINSSLEKLSVISIDCNWPSSVEASLELCLPQAQNGTILYFDDYFVGTRDGDYTKRIMDKFESDLGVKFHFFNSYPPCARAYVIEFLG